MHRDDPVNKNGPHILIDVSLGPHVEAIGLCDLLCVLHVLLDVLAVVAHVVDVRDRGLINLTDLRCHILLNATLIGRQFIVHSNLRQFVSRSEPRLRPSKRIAHGRPLALVLIEIKRVQTLLKTVGWVQAGLSNIALRTNRRGQMRASSGGCRINGGIFCLVVE